MKKSSLYILLISHLFCLTGISQIDQLTLLNSEKDSSSISIEPSINSFIDNRDNNEYTFIKINGVKWMAENLNFYTNTSLTYNNNSENSKVFGRLYSWKEANCVCPNGWHLPTEDEWKQLEAYIGLTPKVIDSIGWRGGELGNMLKSKSRSTWLSDVHIESPSTGFNALAGGVAYDNSFFANFGLGGYYWTSTNYYTSFAWSRYLNYENGEIFRNISLVSWHLSIRCISD